MNHEAETPGPLAPDTSGRSIQLTANFGIGASLLAVAACTLLVIVGSHGHLVLRNRQRC